MARMTVDTPRRRRAAAALAGLLLALLGVLIAPAAPAGAHAVLQSTDPAAGSVVPAAPDRVTLTFTEAVRLVPGRTQVLAPDGSRADQGEPSVAGNAVTIPLRAGGSNGTYLVSFRVISADSHPIGDAFMYSVVTQSAPPTAASDDDGGVDGAVRAAIPVAKYLGYAGLLLVIGPVLVLALLWPHRLPRRNPARLIWTGFGLIAVSTLAGLWLQAPYSTGNGLFDVSGADLRDVLGSTFGAVMLVRLGVVAAAAVLVRPLLSGRGGDSRSDLAVLAVLAVAALATWPLTGHPSASPVAAVSVVVDAVHLAAMAVWLGGLVMLLAFLLPRAEPKELGAILPIWSRWAALSVGALVLAGTVQALVEVGSLDGLTGTGYGRLIMVKVGLVALVLGVAFLARRLVARRVSEDRPKPLRRLIGVELGVTAVILGVTAVLVQVTPARTAIAQAASVGETALVTRTVTTKDFRLQVEVTPAEGGNNSIHLYAYTPAGQPLPVVEWIATAALPARGIEPIDVLLQRITDSHAIGQITLPSGGDWVFKFTLRTSDVDQSSGSTTVSVR